MLSYDNLQLAGIFSDVVLQDIDIHQAYNEHATISITGIIMNDKRESHLKQNLKNQSILLLASGDSKTNVIFNGIVTKVEIDQNTDLYFIKIQGISRSYLLDIQQQNNSYQDIALSYNNVIQDQLSKFNAQCINDDPQKGDAIAQFTLQYQETAWEFIRRLVSKHCIGLVPDIKSDEIAFWVNLPADRESKSMPDCLFESFRIIQHGEINTKNQWIRESETNDFFGYRFFDIIDHYDIGDPIAFDGLPLRIIQIDSHLDKNRAVLMHEITAQTENSCRQPSYYNGFIKGLSLEGSVIDRRKDFTKIHLFTIDKNQDVDTASWFRQPTYYTAGKDAGWCAMPELQDVMSLHFPTVEENDCYLLNSTQIPYNQINANVSKASNSAKQKSGQKSDREIPASKYIHAPNGQVLLLEDDLILFHSQENFSSMALHEEHKDDKGKTLGITLRTKKDINFDAKNIQIGRVNSDISKTVVIESKEGIDFVCALSSIIIDAEKGAHFKSPVVKFYPKIKYNEE